MYCAIGCLLRSCHSYFVDLLNIFEQVANRNIDIPSQRRHMTILTRTFGLEWGHEVYYCGRSRAHTVYCDPSELYLRNQRTWDDEMLE